MEEDLHSSSRFIPNSVATHVTHIVLLRGFLKGLDVPVRRCGPVECFTPVSSVCLRSTLSQMKRADCWTSSYVCIFNDGWPYEKRLGLLPFPNGYTYMARSHSPGTHWRGVYLLDHTVPNGTLVCQSTVVRPATSGFEIYRPYGCMWKHKNNLTFKLVKYTLHVLT